MQVGKQNVHFKSSEEISEVDDVDFIITSPPYWNLKDYQHDDQIGHDESYNKYISRLSSVWEECYKCSNEDAIMVINVGSRRSNKKFYPIAMDIYKNMDDWKLIDNLVWYKPNSLPQPAYYNDKLFDDKYEDLLIFSKNYDYNHTFNKIRIKQKYKDKETREHKMNDSGRGIGNVIKMRSYRPPTIKNQNYHTAAYPEELVYALMHTFSNENDTVLDPFVGSGTTLKVASKMNRFGIGYEINKEYKELIKDRINEDMRDFTWRELDILSEGYDSTDSNDSINGSIFDF